MAEVTYNSKDGTDQGFGNKFSNDPLAIFPSEYTGGSKPMAVLSNGHFQEAQRTTSNPADPLYRA